MVDVSDHLLTALLDGLRRQSLGDLAAPLTAVSAGVVPPPPTEPSTLGPAWQLVSTPEEGEATGLAVVAEEEVPATPAAPDVEMQNADGAVATGGSKPSSRPQSSRPSSAAVKKGSGAAGSATASRITSARPAAAGSRPPSAAARPPSARPGSAAAAGTPGADGAAGPSCSEVEAGMSEVEPEVEPEEEEAGPVPGPAIQKGGEVDGLAHAGVEVAAGARYAGQAPVVSGPEGPCKGCVVS